MRKLPSTNIPLSVPECGLLVSSYLKHLSPHPSHGSTLEPRAENLPEAAVARHLVTAKSKVTSAPRKSGNCSLRGLESIVGGLGPSEIHSDLPYSTIKSPPLPFYNTQEGFVLVWSVFPPLSCHHIPVSLTGCPFLKKLQKT